MKKVDYNIEYGHIFTDAPGMDSSQKKSIELTRNFIEKLKTEGKTFSLNLLIDDYSPSYSYLDLSRYLGEFSKMSVPPDYVLYETGLLEIAKKLLRKEISSDKISSEIEEKEIKFKEEVLMLENPQTDSISLVEEDFLKKPEYFETPLLIAIWFLIRLGYLDSEKLERKVNFKTPKNFTGEKIMTIIPKKWKGIDESAKMIISSTKYKDALKKMESIYF